MRFWTREIAGWLLVGLGLFVFYVCVSLLGSAKFIEGGSLTVIGVVLFRGGVHLIKVAVAAQVCLQAQDKVERPGPRRGARP